MIIWGNIKLNARIRNLIKKIENAPDFGYDDEEVLLRKLLEEKNLRYGWSEKTFNPELIIFKDTEQNLRKLYKQRNIEITPEIEAEEGWKKDVWKIRK